MPRHDPQLVRWCNEDLRLPFHLHGGTLERDLSTGYAFAAVVTAIAPHVGVRIPDNFLATFQHEETTLAKVTNFAKLKPVIQQMGIKFDQKLQDEISTEQRGAAAKLLLELKSHFDVATGAVKRSISPPPPDIMHGTAGGGVSVRSRLASTLRDPPYVQRLLMSGLSSKQVAMELHLKKFDDFRVDVERKAAEADAVEDAKRWESTAARIAALDARRHEQEQWGQGYGTHADAVAAAETQRQNNIERRQLAYELAQMERRRVLQWNASVRGTADEAGGIAAHEARLRRSGIDPYGSATDKKQATMTAAAASALHGGGGGGGGDGSGLDAVESVRRGVVGGVSTGSIAALTHKAPSRAAEATLARTMGNLHRHVIVEATDKLLASGPVPVAPLHLTLESALRGDLAERPEDYLLRMATSFAALYKPRESERYLKDVMRKVKEGRETRRDKETRARLMGAFQASAQAAIGERMARDADTLRYLEDARAQREAAEKVAASRVAKAERLQAGIEWAARQDARIDAKFHVAADRDRAILEVERQRKWAEDAPARNARAKAREDEAAAAHARALRDMREVADMLVDVALEVGDRIEESASQGGEAAILPADWRRIKRRFIDGSIAHARHAAAAAAVRARIRAAERPAGLPVVAAVPEGLRPWGVLLGNRVAGQEHALEGYQAPATTTDDSASSSGGGEGGASGVGLGLVVSGPLAALHPGRWDVATHTADACDLADWSNSTGAWALPSASSPAVSSSGSRSRSSSRGGVGSSSSRAGSRARSPTAALEAAVGLRDSADEQDEEDEQDTAGEEKKDEEAESGSGGGGGGRRVGRRAAAARRTASPSASASPSSSPSDPAYRTWYVSGIRDAPTATWLLHTAVSMMGAAAEAAAEAAEAGGGGGGGEELGPPLLLSSPLRLALHAPLPSSSDAASSADDGGAVAGLSALALSSVCARVASRARMSLITPLHVLCAAVAVFDAENAALAAADPSLSATLPPAPLAQQASIAAALSAWRDACSSEGGEVCVPVSAYSYTGPGEKREAVEGLYDLGAWCAAALGLLHAALLGDGSSSSSSSSSSDGSASAAASAAAPAPAPTGARPATAPATSTSAATAATAAAAGPERITGDRCVDSATLLATLSAISAADIATAAGALTAQRTAALEAAAAAAAAAAAPPADPKDPKAGKGDKKDAGKDSKDKDKKDAKGGKGDAAATAAASASDAAAAAASAAAALEAEAGRTAATLLRRAMLCRPFARALAVVVAQADRRTQRARAEWAAAQAQQAAQGAWDTEPYHHGELVPAGFGGLLLAGLPACDAHVLAIEYALGGELVWQQPSGSGANGSGSGSGGGSANGSSGVSASVSIVEAEAGASASASGASGSSSSIASTGSAETLQQGQQPSAHMPRGWDGKLPSVLSALYDGSWSLPAVGPVAQAAYRKQREEEAAAEKAAAAAAAAAKAAAEADAAAAAAAGKPAAKPAAAPAKAAAAAAPAASAAAGKKGGKDAAAPEPEPAKPAGPPPPPPTTCSLHAVLTLALHLPGLMAGGLEPGSRVLVDAVTGAVTTLPADELPPALPAPAAAPPAEVAAEAGRSKSQPGAKAGGGAPASAAAAGKGAGKKDAAPAAADGGASLAATLAALQPSVRLLCTDAQPAAVLTHGGSSTEAAQCAWYGQICAAVASLQPPTTASTAASTAGDAVGNAAAPLTLLKAAAALELALEHTSAVLTGAPVLRACDLTGEEEGGPEGSWRSALRTALSRGLTLDAPAILTLLAAEAANTAAYRDVAQYALRGMRVLQRHVRSRLRRVGRAVLRLLRGVPDADIPQRFQPAMAQMAATAPELEKQIMLARAKANETSAYVRIGESSGQGGGSTSPTSRKIEAATTAMDGTTKGRPHPTSTLLAMPGRGEGRKPEHCIITVGSGAVTNPEFQRLAARIAALEVTDATRHREAVEALCQQADAAGAALWAHAEQVRDGAEALIATLAEDGWLEDCCSVVGAQAAALLHIDARRLQDETAFLLLANDLVVKAVQEQYAQLCSCVHVQTSKNSSATSGSAAVEVPLSATAAAAGDATSATTQQLSLELQPEAVTALSHAPELQELLLPVRAHISGVAAAAATNAAAAEAVLGAAHASWRRSTNTAAVCARLTAAIARSRAEVLDSCARDVRTWLQARNAAIFGVVKHIQASLRASADPAAYAQAVADEERKSKLALALTVGSGQLHSRGGGGGGGGATAGLPLSRAGSRRGESRSAPTTPATAALLTLPRTTVDDPSIVTERRPSISGGIAPLLRTGAVGGALPKLSPADFLVPAADGLSDMYGWITCPEACTDKVMWDGRHVAGGGGGEHEHEEEDGGRPGSPSSSASGGSGSSSSANSGLIAAMDELDSALQSFFSVAHAVDDKFTSSSMTVPRSPTAAETRQAQTQAQAQAQGQSQSQLALAGGKTSGLPPTGRQQQQQQQQAAMEGANAISTAIHSGEACHPAVWISGKGIQALIESLLSIAGAATGTAYAAAAAAAQQAAGPPPRSSSSSRSGVSAASRPATRDARSASGGGAFGSLEQGEDSDAAALRTCARQLRAAVQQAAARLGAGSGSGGGSSEAHIPYSFLHAPGATWMALSRGFAASPSGTNGYGYCWTLLAVRKLAIALLFTRLKLLPDVPQLLLFRRNLVAAAGEDGVCQQHEWAGCLLPWDTLSARATELLEHAEDESVRLARKIANARRRKTMAAVGGSILVHISPESAVAQGGARHPDTVHQHTLLATSAAGRYSDSTAMRELLWLLYSMPHPQLAGTPAGSVAGQDLDSLPLLLDLCADPGSHAAVWATAGLSFHGRDRATAPVAHSHAHAGGFHSGGGGFGGGAGAGAGGSGGGLAEGGEAAGLLLPITAAHGHGAGAHAALHRAHAVHGLPRVSGLAKALVVANESDVVTTAAALRPQQLAVSVRAMAAAVAHAVGEHVSATDDAAAVTARLMSCPVPGVSAVGAALRAVAAAAETQGQGQGEGQEDSLTGPPVTFSFLLDRAAAALAAATHGSSGGADSDTNAGILQVLQLCPYSMPYNPVDCVPPAASAAAAAAVVLHS